LFGSSCLFVVVFCPSSVGSPNRCLQAMGMRRRSFHYGNAAPPAPSCAMDVARRRSRGPRPPTSSQSFVAWCVNPAGSQPLRRGSSQMSAFVDQFQPPPRLSKPSASEGQPSSPAPRNCVMCANTAIPNTNLTTDPPAPPLTSHTPLPQYAEWVQEPTL